MDRFRDKLCINNCKYEVDISEFNEMSKMTNIHLDLSIQYAVHGELIACGIIRPNLAGQKDTRVGVAKPIYFILLFTKFFKTINDMGYLLNGVFIFDMCHCSLAIKY